MTAIEPMADVTFGGGVDTVLQSARTSPPPATLEEARNQPGRRERIEEITRRIESEGIKYVFFQQVSITGRVMGKGVVASFFPQVAEKGYQLVYGATANLFTDRAGDYIGFGPEESELAAMADLDTFARLPWDPRVARVYCDCYDTETGKLLDADPRQNLKRVVAEFEEELGLDFLIGIEPEMMWLKQDPDGGPPDGVTKPYCYHIHQFEELRPVLLDVVDYGQALGLDMSYGDHEDAPGQLELNFRFDRPVKTADNITTYRQICAAVGRKHGLLPTFMPKPFSKYEPVAGAVANDLAAAVPPEVKEQRWHRFMQRQQAISAKRLRARVGTRQQVIIDESVRPSPRAEARAMHPRSMVLSMWRAAAQCGSARSPRCASSAPTITTFTARPSGFDDNAGDHRRSGDHGCGRLPAVGQAPQLRCLLRPCETCRLAPRHRTGRLRQPHPPHDAERRAGLPRRALPERGAGCRAEELSCCGGAITCAKLKTVARAQPRISDLSCEPNCDRTARFVQRTRLMRFPDTIDVEVLPVSEHEFYTRDLFAQSAWPQ